MVDGLGLLRPHRLQKPPQAPLPSAQVPADHTTTFITPYTMHMWTDAVRTQTRSGGLREDNMQTTRRLCIRHSPSVRPSVTLCPSVRPSAADQTTQQATHPHTHPLPHPPTHPPTDGSLGTPDGSLGRPRREPGHPRREPEQSLTESYGDDDLAVMTTVAMSR